MTLEFEQRNGKLYGGDPSSVVLPMLLLPVNDS